MHLISPPACPAGPVGKQSEVIENRTDPCMLPGAVTPSPYKARFLKGLKNLRDREDNPKQNIQVVEYCKARNNYF